MTAAAPEHPHSLPPHQHQMQHPHPQHPHSFPREQSREHDRDVHGLRLALGSILSPKRLSTPSSHASSGTASPCPAHFGPGLVHSYHHGPSHLHTPVETHDESDILGHAARAQEEAGMNGHTQVTVPQRPSLATSHANSSANPTRELETPPPILTTSNVHSLSAQQQQNVLDSQDTTQYKSKTDAYLKHAAKEKLQQEGKENEARGLGAYIATLQSARAWDALVHGNMS